VIKAENGAESSKRWGISNKEQGMLNVEVIPTCLQIMGFY